MRYLYGDSSPFPLAENFLATLSSATETCIALLKADEMYTVGREAIERAEECFLQETSRLDELARSFDGSLRAHLPAETPSSVTEAAAVRLSELGRATIEDARAGTVRWRDGVVKSAMGNAAELIFSSLGTFLSRHQLPRTTWSMRWSACVGEKKPRGEVEGRAPCGLEATLEVDVPAEHVWARPVRVGSLERSLTVQMMKKGLIGKPRLRDERLDRYYLTGLESSPERAVMVLSRSAKEPSPGLELCVRGGPEPSPDVIATAIDAAGTKVGPGVALRPSDSASVQRLWRRVEELAADLVPYRRRLKTASLRGVGVLEIERPEAIAQAIISSIAPLVREVQRRSRTPGELALKREVGDGQRQEIFVTNEVLLRETHGLWLGHRSLFDAFGLETSESATLVRVAPHVLPRPRRETPYALLMD